jgi:hypothetical protein
MEMLVYFVAIWSIFRSFGIFLWQIGMLCKEKSGIPGRGLGLGLLSTVVSDRFTVRTYNTLVATAF